jgi:hypothetical protein
MPGCSDEVWAACSVGSCLTLLCYEHFCGNLSHAHEPSCKGKGHPQQLMLASQGLTAIPEPAITAIPGKANNQQKLSTNLPAALPTDRSSDCPANVSENNCVLLAASSPSKSIHAIYMTSSSSEVDAADSNDKMLASVNHAVRPNMFAYDSPCHPDVKLIRKQLIVHKNGKTRVLSFQASWFAQFPWIHYCNEVQGVLCFYCAKADAIKLSSLAKKSHSHRFAMQQLVQATKPVDQQLSLQRMACQQQGRRCLSVIFTSLQHLARQGLAVRGYDGKKGNFIQLLKLRANDVPELQQWLERKVNMTSHHIQNEILDLFGHSVVRKICRRIQQAGMFAIIVDGTQDIARKEQMSICVRYVDDDFCPHEEFLGLYELPETTGKVLAKCIDDVLLRLQLPLSALRGQIYDGASNMSGQYKGCQAVRREKQPLALYVHCCAHCTNLVSKSVSEAVTPVRDAMQLLQELGSLFSQSLKCRSSFAKIAESNEGIFRVQQISPLALHAAWLVRVSAIQALITQYELVLSCLEMSLPAAGSSVTARASAIYSQLSKGSTLLVLMMALKVFGPLEMLNRSLQARNQTVSGMLAAVGETLSALRNIREEVAFDQLLEGTEQVEAEINLEELKAPLQRKPPKRYTGDAVGHVATTLCEYYRPMYFLLVGTAVQQLEERFHGNSSLLKYQALESILLTENCKNIMANLLDFKDIDWPDLQIHLELFRRKRSLKCLHDAVDYLKCIAIFHELRAGYSEVEKLVRLLLISPA